MISQKMLAALNEQIKHELYSSYLYLSMNAWAEGQNLKGFANWLGIQAKEEHGHAMKFYDYLIDIGATPVVPAIDQPPADFQNPTKMFENVLAHEKKITGLIHSLYAMAVDDKDYRSQIMLQWFVTEQIEEESNATEILSKLTAIGDKSSALYWIDKELKKRGK
jgi:ferritin